MPSVGMGLHWNDPDAPERKGAPFTQTFIYGSYDGAMIFGEPMVAKSYLETKPAAVVTPLKLPTQYALRGYQATSYTRSPTTPVRKSIGSLSPASFRVRPMRSSLAVVAAALLACAGSEPTTTAVGPAVGLSISPPALSLMVGDEAHLTARAFDAKGRTTTTPFVWSTANPAVATVGRSDGIVTAIAAGATTVTATAGTLSATAAVSIRPPDPPVSISITSSALTLIPGGVERLVARAFDAAGRATSVTFEWTSADPAVASVGKTDGIVTAISLGSTTVTAAVGALRATATVSVEPEIFSQWAMGATASTEWSPDEWSASQATGTPNVSGCVDDPNAWATLSQAGVDWLELTFAQPVRPSEIRIHEVWAVGSIVKVEVKDISGAYHTVYTAQPIGPVICPRILTIAITDVTAMVSTVRVSVDQRVRLDWNEIDAVRLSGYR
jgi:large repetitive protein